jgi:hypothetical protein
MKQMLIHHPVACLIAVLLLVTLTSAADRLGLIAWLAWLDRHKHKGYRRVQKSHGETTKEYWRVYE